MGDADTVNKVASVTCPSCQIAVWRFIAKVTLKDGTVKRRHKCPACGHTGFTNLAGDIIERTKPQRFCACGTALRFVKSYAKNSRYACPACEREFRRAHGTDTLVSEEEYQRLMRHCVKSQAMRRYVSKVAAEKAPKATPAKGKPHQQLAERLGLDDMDDLLIDDSETPELPGLLDKQKIREKRDWLFERQLRRDLHLDDDPLFP